MNEKKSFGIGGAGNIRTDIALHSQWGRYLLICSSIAGSKAEIKEKIEKEEQKEEEGGVSCKSSTHSLPNRHGRADKEMTRRTDKPSQPSPLPPPPKKQSLVWPLERAFGLLVGELGDGEAAAEGVEGE